MITLGVKDGDFVCDDPTATAWRLIALIDGLAVQVTVHQRVLSRKQLLEWVRDATARELNIDPASLA